MDSEGEAEETYVM